MLNIVIIEMYLVNQMKLEIPGDQLKTNSLIIVGNQDDENKCMLCSI